MIFNLESSDKKHKKPKINKHKTAVGLGSIVSLLGIGSTLAANISLNGGGNVEFGQGVASTAACDEDGFNITPVTEYDNLNSIFRVSSLQISGLNLTPEGTGWNLTGSNVSDQNSGGVDQSDAKLQYPGQYFDGSNWKRTCDNVALDFHAYTNDVAFAKYTKAGYVNPSTTDISQPIMWSQRFDGSGNLIGVGSFGLNSPGIAAAINVVDDGSDYDSNYGWDAHTVNWDQYWGDNTGFGINNVELSNVTSSSFSFVFTDWRPNAAGISKITVQSMKFFPENYYDDNDGPGHNPNQQ